MRKIEKQMIGSLFLFIVLLAYLVIIVSDSIENSGGVKQIIIELGKDIKEIKEEIDK